MKPILYLTSSEGHQWFQERLFLNYKATMSNNKETPSKILRTQRRLPVLPLRHDKAEENPSKESKKRHPGIPRMGYPTPIRCPGQYAEWIVFYLMNHN
jgi:hypothetical protein